MSSSKVLADREVCVYVRSYCHQPKHFRENGKVTSMLDLEVARKLDSFLFESMGEMIFFSPVLRI